MSNFINMSNEPSLMGVLSVFKKHLSDDLCCIKIGYIDEYNPNTRVSRVIIYNKRVMGVKENGEHILSDYPPLYCKTLFLGGNGHGINWQVSKGDECIIFFADREIETPWLSGQVSDLKYGRMHNYTDAICITGFTTLPNVTATDNNINIYNNNGIINITGDTVINGNLVINGDLTVTGDATIGGISFLSHVHSNGNQGQDTGIAK